MGAHIPFPFPLTTHIPISPPLPVLLLLLLIFVLILLPHLPSYRLFASAFLQDVVQPLCTGPALRPAPLLLVQWTTGRSLQMPYTDHVRCYTRLGEAKVFNAMCKARRGAQCQMWRSRVSLVFSPSRPRASHPQPWGLPARHPIPRDFCSQGSGKAPAAPASCIHPSRLGGGGGGRGGRAEGGGGGAGGGFGGRAEGKEGLKGQ